MKNIITVLIIISLFSCSKSVSVAKQLSGKWLLIESYENDVSIPISKDSIDGVFIENQEDYKNIVGFDYYKSSRVEMYYEIQDVVLNPNTGNLRFSEESNTFSLGNFDIEEKGKVLEMQNSSATFAKINLEGTLLEIFYGDTDFYKNVYLKQ